MKTPLPHLASGFSPGTECSRLASWDPIGQAVAGRSNKSVSETIIRKDGVHLPLVPPSPGHNLTVKPSAGTLEQLEGSGRVSL